MPKKEWKKSISSWGKGLTNRETPKDQFQHPASKRTLRRKIRGIFVNVIK